MRSYRGLVWQIFLAAFIFVLFCSKVSFGQQSSGTLRGQVADELGGLIVGATVTAADASGVEKTATTDDEGRYSFSSLAPGRYTVRVVAPGFALYENAEVEVAAGGTDPLNITLPVAIEEQVVTVTEEAEINTDPDNNAGALVLRGADLDSLPDDPDALADALQALAGPSTGAEGGGEIFLDGFSGGRLPPKESIREIRINRNPFSAEYDRLGYGRIEIFTKPGTDKFRGQAFFNFNDEALNSRDPFAPERASFQRRRYGGNLSGPIVSKRASFFLDFQRNETDDNEVVNAVILDDALNPTPFGLAVVTPRRSTTFSPRFDWQLNQTNTLVGRYSYERTRRSNVGVGDFSLPSRAYDTSSTEHTLQLTETAVINQKVINETRFQYVRARSVSEGDDSEPTIRVLEAFTGGGSQVGFSFNNEDRFELQNYTSWTMGNHSLKAGARLRHTRLTDSSPQNFAGTYTFAGGIGPQLDANNQVVLDGAGQPVLVPLTSIERYRRTLLFQQQGLTPTQIRVLGGGATQFSIAGGNPLASVTQTDFSPFIQDDWRVRPNLTLSLGLRYEAQTNIDSSLDFAPRVAFAWSPGGGGSQQRQKTVIRGGFGIFFNRVGQNLTLQEERFNGTNQQQFVVTTNTTNGFDVLDLFPAVPSLADLAAFSIPQTTRTLADDLRTPYTMQTAVSVERQLPYRMTLSVNFVSARTLHVLRSRNINAPLPGTFVLGVPGSGVRPFPGLGNIFQYESSGRFNQNQLIVSLNNRFSPKFTMFATYTLNDASSDTDGSGSFPVNQYDLSSEYGRSSQDIRHRFFIGGQVNALPWGIRLNPLVTINSGRPFNITTGRDTNGDTLFTERPAFATDLSKPGVVVTRFGAFDPNPLPGQELIPRNFGTGPSFFTVNLRASKTFSFGEAPSAATGAQGGGGGGGR
ncbi:MAG TPA: carboxypeptidase regulatory-like domain-containing protein, partial [Pyrinomonadaceae bacterium]|nr:carboxypeptidase regulatory-like domain-containing protein [Pyrinomonadaceae bacterium]